MDWTKYKNKGPGQWNFSKDLKWKFGHITYRGDAGKLIILKLKGFFTAGKWSGRGAKFTSSKWRPVKITPFSCEKVQKLYYDDGYRITSYLDATFGVIPPPVEHYFQGVHNPCGYWWRFPVYNNCYILTSKLYPIYIHDYLSNTIELIDGHFGDVIKVYAYGPESLNLSVDIIDGDFSTKLFKYSYGESLNIEIAPVSGVFKDVLHIYNCDDESLNLTINCTSGIFRVAIVNYTNGKYEPISITSIYPTGGSFGS